MIQKGGAFVDTQEEKKEKRLRRYPYFLGIVIIGVVSCLAQAVLILDCFFPVLSLDPDAVSSVMSTCSEVVAGLYGITLTGYIFFADRFQDTSREDESLYDIVQALLVRYNHLAGFIAVLCLMCIVLGEGIVIYGTNTILHPVLYRFIVWETLLFFFCTFNFILYFVISVLDPQKISRISSQKKEKLSDDKESGDLAQFLADYSQIEQLLYGQLEKMLGSMRFVPNPAKSRKPRMVATLETLRNYSRISHSLWRKLERLRQYHSMTLHDPNMHVTKEICQLAKEIRQELEQKNSQ